MSSSYKRLTIKRFPRVQERETAEARYWRNFTNPEVQTHNAPVSCIHFSATAPHDFAVTCSTHVSLHAAVTGRQIRSVGRFDHVAYSAQLRSDGKLMGTGDHTGTVIDVKTKGILRAFREHKAPTRVVRWSCDGLQLASGSDDKTLRLWDLPTSTAVQVRQGHADYVRALAASPSSPDTWISGSYDHTVKMWDTRQPKRNVLELSHGAPVEACLFLPGGGLCVSAGGNEVKASVWDLLGGGGGRLLHTLANHQKTVTCLALDGTGSRLLTGGLDRHVKIYNLENFKVVHMLKYQAPVLALALAPDNSSLVAATTDRALTIRRRDLRHAAALAEREMAKSGRIGGPVGSDGGPRSVRTGTARYFNRGKTEGAGEGDVKVASRKSRAIASYDESLRKFRFREALDRGLATGSPLVVAALLEALTERGALEKALSGRDAAGLEPVVAYLARHLTNPRHTEQLIAVTSSVLDMYGDVVASSPKALSLFAKLRAQVKREVGFQKDMLSMLGAMDGVVCAAGDGRGGDIGGVPP
ncbi:unnamed protein product [Ectocarpus sp. CCAP 1310/34]|nr:unnamed protein product [Ectocarpus sp. CCAP 1310/34]